LSSHNSLFFGAALLRGSNALSVPDQDGPLLKSILPSSIQAANDAWIEALIHCSHVVAIT